MWICTTVIRLATVTSIGDRHQRDSKPKQARFQGSGPNVIVNLTAVVCMAHISDLEPTPVKTSGPDGSNGGLSEGLHILPSDNGPLSVPDLPWTRFRALFFFY